MEYNTVFEDRAVISFYYGTEFKVATELRLK